MKYIKTDKAPKAIGPYSQAILINNNLYLSGQIGIDPTTNVLQENFEKQTCQIFTNIKAILEEEHFTRNDIAKVVVYLRNLNDFNALNVIYENFFENHKPARTTIEVSNLPKNALIEIDVIAITTIN
jgi:2-iminobutanoate/2-iminopropanoate deaminase